jgi:hypothetical protein
MMALGSFGVILAAPAGVQAPLAVELHRFHPAGNGSNPVCKSRHDGADNDAPRWPQREHLRLRRSASLETPLPQRMTKGANGNGIRCEHSRLLQ